MGLLSRHVVHQVGISIQLRVIIDDRAAFLQGCTGKIAGINLSLLLLLPRHIVIGVSWLGSAGVAAQWGLSRSSHVVRGGVL